MEEDDYMVTKLGLELVFIFRGEFTRTVSIIDILMNKNTSIEPDAEAEAADGHRTDSLVEFNLTS